MTVGDEHATCSIAQLSWDALRLAARLPARDELRLAGWLYRFNTIPVSPPAMRRLSHQSLSGRIGAPVNDFKQSLVAANWSSSISQGWQYLTRDRPAGHRNRFKLYVSPHPDDLGGTLDALAASLTASRAAVVKLPLAALGAYRPDKIIAYFATRADLERSVAGLARPLAGMRAQPVPFTCAISDDGLLSWGVDPGDSAGDSWRLSVCRLLGRHLVLERESPGVPAAGRALRKAAAEAFELPSWRPRYS